MSEYYDRQGQPITAQQWVGLLNEKHRRVAATQVGGIWISTVWLGLDHRWGHGPPVIFESMAFHRQNGRLSGELDSARYSTEIQALAGHDQMVARARERHHGWVKYARDQRRSQMKYYLTLLERRNELNEMEEAMLQLWLGRRR